eukprot:TRINITY_DN3926_c0_g1_i2.p1 TRINITY_DN3926_c0_g1~~TRINITY_DN3926_c0_g1_i2.p1  ORF type:complete len:757 (-),score=140.67 TRINITY_DN3926_c0_g1_i2:306-2576(-)
MTIVDANIAEIDGLSMEKLIAEKFPPGSSSTGAEFFGGKQDDHSINYIPSEKSTFTRDSESRKWPTVYQELAGRQDTQESSWVLNLLRSQGDSHQRELLQSGEGYDAYILGHMMEKEHYGRFNQDNLLSLFGQSGTERPAFDTNQPTFGASASASTFAGVANNTPFLSSNSSALETLSEPPFNTKINEQQASDIFSKLTLGSESGMPPFFGEHSAHHGTQPALWSGAHGNSVPQRSEFAGASQTHGVSHASLNQPFLESPGTNYGAAAARSLKPNQYQGQIPETMFGALDGVVGTSASSSVLGAASSSAGKSVANAPTNHTDGNNVPIPFPMPFTMGAPKAAPVAAQNTVLGTNHTGTLSSDRKAPPQGVGSILTQLMSQAQSSLADGQQSQVADKIGFPFPFPPSSVAQDQQGKGQPSSAATSLPPGHMLQSTSGSVLPPLPFPFNPVHEGHSSQDSFSTQGLAVGFDSRQSHMGIPPFSSPLDLAYGRHPHHPAGLQDSSVGIPLTAAANLPLVPPSYIPPEGISILDIFQTNVHQPNAASMLPAPSATYQVAPQLQLPLQPPALGQDTMPPNHQVASQPQTLPKANTQHPQHVPLTIPPQINPNIRPQGSSQSQYQQPPQLYQLPNHQGQHPTYSNQTQSSSGLPSQSLPQFHQANYYPMMSNPNTHQEPGHGFPENRPFTEFPYPGAIPGVFPIMPFGVTGPQMQAPVGTDLLQQLFDISSQAPAPERKSNSSAALSLEDLEKQLLCKTTPN